MMQKKKASVKKATLNNKIHPKFKLSEKESLTISIAILQKLLALLNKKKNKF